MVEKPVFRRKQFNNTKIYLNSDKFCIDRMLQKFLTNHAINLLILFKNLPIT